MFIKAIFWLSLLSCVLNFDPVLSAIFCKDSVIDAITYVEERKMWFIVSEGHYWWIAKTQFPPSDEEAKPLPSPFKKPTSAVYIDTLSGCPNLRSNRGVRQKEKEIWITEIIGREIKLMGYDLQIFEWTPEPVTIEADHCIGRAKIDFTVDIDAMFARNYLQIYVIQSNKYVMTDCSELCINPEEYGSSRDKHDIKDWESTEKIDAMTVEGRELLLIQGQVYYNLRIQSENNGRIEARKTGAAKNVSTDFFRVNGSEECASVTTIPPPEDTAETELTIDTEKPVLTPEPVPANTNPPAQSVPEKDKGFPVWLMILIIVFLILLLLAVCVGLFLCGFCAVKKPKKAVADMEAQPSGRTHSSNMNSKADSKVSSKVVASKVVSKGGKSALTKTEIKSTRSGIAGSPVKSSQAKSSSVTTTSKK